VAAVGVTGRIGVVFEKVNIAVDPLIGETLLCRREQLFENALPRLVVHHNIVDRVALGSCILGMGANVEIQPSAVLEKDV